MYSMRFWASTLKKLENYIQTGKDYRVRIDGRCTRNKADLSSVSKPGPFFSPDPDR